MNSPGAVSRRLWVVLAVALAAGGCALFAQQRHHASSVVEYLYAGEVGHVVEPDTPVLRLPLRVGVAFVPSLSREGGISEKERLELMNAIVPHFERLDFVSSIEVIPSAYLRPRGGFTNLDQLRTMFGIDVIALLSYDQAQFTGEDFTSLSYWTLVGAYVVRGERNDTHTMVDAAVYDIPSRTLLFRAPGISEVKGRATPIALEERLRSDRMTGFRAASDDLVTNVAAQLEGFRERVRTKRADVRVEHRPGYTGGGQLGGLALGVLLALAWLGARGRSRS